jgi:hypothetical protein
LESKTLQLESDLLFKEEKSKQNEQHFILPMTRLYQQVLTFENDTHVATFHFAGTTDHAPTFQFDVETFQ